jgi:hypothetical protein
MQPLGRRTHQFFMGLIDLILNIAGLLLWLNWRSLQIDPMRTARPSTLAGTLRRAEPPRVKRWHFPAALIGLLLVRAVFYWQLGSPANWSAMLNPGVIRVSFASFGEGGFSRMLLFSLLSFGVVLGAFLICMVCLSVLGGSGKEFEGVRKFVRLHINGLDALPWPLRLLLPLVGVGLSWWCLNWLLVRWAILPPPASEAHRFEQALVLGLGSYLVWKYVIAVVLILHLVNSYVYLGKHLFWSHLNTVARRLLAVLRWVPLCAGKVDFAPVVLLALTFVLATLLENWLTSVFGILPL